MTTKTEMTTPIAVRELNKLCDDQLDKVTGGVTVTKVVDASSPNLFIGCATGKHYSTGRV